MKKPTKATKPTGESLHSRTARRRAQLCTCHCGAPLLTGYDNDWAGLRVSVEIVTLSHLGELAAAAFEGRRTATIDDGRIQYRDDDRRRRPSRDPTLAEHLCDRPVPAAWRATPTPTTETKETDECPF